MYLLIFEAWATLMGFTKGNVHIIWGNSGLEQIMPDMEDVAPITDWQMLSLANPSYLTGDGLYGGSAYEGWGATQALMLTNIMTHVSMILIFVFFVSFIIFLFRLFAHMLSRR